MVPINRLIGCEILGDKKAGVAYHLLADKIKELKTLITINSLDGTIRRRTSLSLTFAARVIFA